MGVGFEGKALRKIGVEHCEVYTEAECVGVYLCFGLRVRLLFVRKGIEGVACD